ncbi:MAG: hypothetical protein HOD85_26330 [Deltaproteobacteria bacterium]|nr:hypothetical protein [Deltaproteobacteria bacterium]
MKTTHHSTIRQLLFLICFMLVSATSTQAESNLITRFQSRYFENIADQMYLTREIPKNIGLAIEYYKKAIAAEPDRPGIHWKITRCYWVLATKRSLNLEERLQYLKEGILFGKISIETDPSNSNAFVWQALIHGENALAKGVMNTIYMRTQIREWLEKAVALDPKNINALLGLAAWFYHLPEFFGGDKVQTFRYIDQAEAIEPNYTAIYIQKAQYLISEKRYRQAAIVLKRVLKIKIPKLRNDGAEDKATSLRLLEKLKNNGHLPSA